MVDKLWLQQQKEAEKKLEVMTKDDAGITKEEFSIYQTVRHLPEAVRLYERKNMIRLTWFINRQLKGRGLSKRKTALIIKDFDKLKQKYEPEE